MRLEEAKMMVEAKMLKGEAHGELFYSECGVKLTKENVEQLLTTCSVIQHDAPTFEMAAKMHKFLGSLVRSFERMCLEEKYDDVMQNTEVEVQNFRRSGSTSYYDRIVITFGLKRKYVVMYKSPGLGTYSIFEGGSNPSKKNLGRLSQVVEYILKKEGLS